MTVLEKQSQPDKLTEREKRFCATYARTGNRVTAYKEAGYKWEEGGKSTKYMSQYISAILRRGKVRREIDRIQNELQERRLTRDEITADFIRDEHARLAKLAEEKGDLTNATRNLEAIGKMIGAYADQVSRMDINIRREWTPEELATINHIADALTLGVAPEPIIDAQVIELQGLPALPAISE